LVLKNDIKKELKETILKEEIPIEESWYISNWYYRKYSI
jgi:hypothetical protein